MKSTKFKVRGSIIAGIAFAACFAATLALDQVASAEQELPYQTNEQGQTYGTSGNPETGEVYATPPDLRAATATNGASGYISNAEGEAAIDRWRAMDGTELTNEQGAALAEAARERFGVDVVTDEAATAYIRTRQSSPGSNEPEKTLEASIASTFVDKAKAGEIAPSQITKLQQSGLVSWNGREGFHLFEPSASEVAQAAENGSLTASGMISDETISDIVQAAREKTAARIPVYTSDGKTVVGEFMITCM